MKSLKLLSFGLLGFIIILLAVMSVGDKLGFPEMYSSWWMMSLWGALATIALIYMFRSRVYRKMAVFSIHLSFAVILSGAALTHFTGLSGSIHLKQKEYADSFDLGSGRKFKLPFTVGLSEFNIVTYPGTSAPMDFESRIEILDGRDTIQGLVSMNNVYEHRGYRFYQSSYNQDGGVTLAISHDPAGIALSYAGYLLLAISVVFYFFSKNSGFRKAISRLSRASVVAVFFTATSHVSAAEPEGLVVPESVASRFGQVTVYYNDRMAPLSTMASDFVMNLYGGFDYHGCSPDQVLAGFVFDFSRWKDEPIIKVKNKDLRRLLGVESGYATYDDFFKAIAFGKIDSDNILSDSLKPYQADLAKFESINMLVTGSLMKIFPVSGSNGDVRWYSPVSGDIPMDTDTDKWLFIRKGLGYLNEQIQARRYDKAVSLIEKIEKYQQQECGRVMPPVWKRKLEISYNRFNRPRPLAMACLFLGLVSFIYFCISCCPNRVVIVSCRIVLSLLVIILTAMIVVRWIISGHVPVSNGSETMAFMSWCSVVAALLFSWRWTMIMPLGIIVSGVALLVASFSGSGSVTQLLPVLASPLMSVHVAVIMLSYSLFAFMMLNGIASLAVMRMKDGGERVARLADISRVMLYPAVFLLSIGMFIGAVWANQSWGRYWGWDPKEVWALITMLVYSFALHQGCIGMFRDPVRFHLFSIIAFMSVVITYFGVNFILGGLHSYA